MIIMNKSNLPDVRRKKRVVGVVAIALLIVFTVLGLIGVFSFIEWVIADLVVALIGNLLLRRLDKQARPASK